MLPRLLPKKSTETTMFSTTLKFPARENVNELVAFMATYEDKPVLGL